jgi:hypothetical protein
VDQAELDTTIHTNPLPGQLVQKICPPRHLTEERKMDQIDPLEQVYSKKLETQMQWMCCQIGSTNGAKHKTTKEVVLFYAAAAG